MTWWQCPAELPPESAGGDTYLSELGAGLEPAFPSLRTEVSLLPIRRPLLIDLYFDNLGSGNGTLLVF
jgi:hypothetical protein